jgi:hypothetical protein
MTPDKAAIEAELDDARGIQGIALAVRMLLEMFEARTTDMREDLDEAGAWIAGVEERLAALEKTSEAGAHSLGVRPPSDGDPIPPSRQAEAPNELGTTSAAPDPFCQKHSNPSGTRSERDACVGCAPDFVAMVSISREEWDALKAVEALAREVHATQPEATITHDAVERLDAARANAHRLQAPADGSVTLTSEQYAKLLSNQSPAPPALDVEEIRRSERRLAYEHAAEVVAHTFPTSDAVGRLRNLAEDYGSVLRERGGRCRRAK